MIGERLRQARVVAGLTQEQVVGALTKREASLTKAGLSKYERGGSTPPASLLRKLASVLNVRTGYFLEEPSVAIEWLRFRKLAKLGKTRQERIKAVASDAVEGQVRLQEILYPGSKRSIPQRVKVRSPDDAERAAANLRHTWRIEDAPIDSVTETVEDQGGIVVMCNEDPGLFDGLSGWANGRYPVAVVCERVPDDRRRLNLAHELGHLTMDCEDAREAEQEKLAFRFAAAFLVPAAVARLELGDRRRNLYLEELGLLKQKHGLSMQAWIRRAFDLEIITEGHYQMLNRRFRSSGWHKREPVDYTGNERPVRLRQMAMHAMAEGLIAPDEAEKLCPGSTEVLERDLEGRPEGYVSATEIMKLPRHQREEILTHAAAEAEEAYRTDPRLRGFDAFGEEEFYDDPS